MKQLPLCSASFLRRRFRAPLSRKQSASGLALVIVLGMLVLSAILVVAFLSSVSTELRSAKSYAVGIDSRSLTDSAVNIVISQIQDATYTANQNYAWASQPGMIRTYDSSGNPVTAYKLYSADQLRVTGTYNPVTSVTTEIPSTWASSPDQYVDLNKPVTVSGVSHYPIINPSAVAVSQSGTISLDGTSTPIQGCYIDQNDLDASLCIPATSSTPTVNPVPMPVKWLYVLQDGTLATISKTGIITSSGTSVPSTANPVVGRIAFWTDDETCKVNVNTSSEGTFWGRPHTESPGTYDPVTGKVTAYNGYERSFLANTLPAQNEFQRYPGHPAMTSLSVIFPPQDGESIAAYNERIYGIIPRVVGGGSKSGTASVTGTTTMTPDSDRLFASVDEFMFAATSSGSTTRTASYKSPSANFTQDDIEKTRFFLTASSRAPEVNMFNKPRIALWPLQANTATVSDPVNATNRTAKDKLIAFCSTIGNVPYYFQRYNTFDTSTIRKNGQTYPASLSQSPIPSSQSPYLDWTMIPRNQSLYMYLQTLGSTPIPGLGGQLTGSGGKYTTNVYNQILTEMVDFIRSEVTTATTGTSMTGTFFYAPGQPPPASTIITAERQVVPLIPPSGTPGFGTKGFGRFETIQQAALVFYRMDKIAFSYVKDSHGADTNTIDASTIVPTPAIANATTPIHVGIVLLLNPFNPTPGSRSWCENMRVQVSGLSGIRINGLPLTTNANDPFDTAPMPDPGTVLLTGINDTVNASALMGPEFFFRYNPVNGGTGYKPLSTSASGSMVYTDATGNTYVHGGTMPGIGTDTEEQYYPFCGSFTLTGTSTTFKFTPPASITLTIYPGYATALNSADLVQTINMPFPSGNVTLSIPTVAYNALNIAGDIANPKRAGSQVYTVPDPGGKEYLSANLYTDFNYRIGSTPMPNGGTYPEQGIDNDNPSPQHNPSPYIVSTDAVRSVEARYKGPAMGDLRVFAALKTVPPEYFNSYGAAGLSANSPAADDSGVSGYSSTTPIVHSLRMLDNPNGTGNGMGTYTGYLGTQGRLINGATTSGNFSYYEIAKGKYSSFPIVPRGLTPYQVQLTGLNGTLYPGDWDTGPGGQPDGPYINKPDESNSGYQGAYTQGSSQYAGGSEPEDQGSTYSPNRQISSAVAFGSLPSGIDQSSPDAVKPWQTLLFCANPAAGAQHPGFGQKPAGTPATAPPYAVPPDHAFLDFFTMPIVEPYAISEPFSTAGKVNMNYQIVPFTYLIRDTAVRAVLKSVRMMAIPSSDSGQNGTSTTLPAYKITSTSPPSYRYTINPDESTGTLTGFQNRFSSGDIFRSASEICNIYLVPQYKVDCTITGNGETITGTAAAGSPTYSTMNTWWGNGVSFASVASGNTTASGAYALTGDNVREEPYGYIYPRLTTKSNTFTVHVITQTLKKVPSTAANTFIGGTDQVTSEYRGSYIVQRYLDPNSNSLISTDGTTPSETNANSVVGPYKFRIVGTKRFAP